MFGSRVQVKDGILWYQCLLRESVSIGVPWLVRIWTKDFPRPAPASLRAMARNSQSVEMMALPEGQDSFRSAAAMVRLLSEDGVQDPDEGHARGNGQKLQNSNLCGS